MGALGQQGIATFKKKKMLIILRNKKKKKKMPQAMFECKIGNV